MIKKKAKGVKRVKKAKEVFLFSNSIKLQIIVKNINLKVFLLYIYIVLKANIILYHWMRIFLLAILIQKMEVNHMIKALHLMIWGKF